MTITIASIASIAAFIVLITIAYELYAFKRDLKDDFNHLSKS